MRVIDLAKRAGVSGHTIRYYTRCGLLKPRKDDSGYHRYGQEDLARLMFIRYLRKLSLPLEKIEELLELAEDGGLPLHVMQECLREEFQREQDEVEERLGVMQRLHKVMENGSSFDREKKLSLQELEMFFAELQID